MAERVGGKDAKKGKKIRVKNSGIHSKIEDLVCERSPKGRVRYINQRHKKVTTCLLRLCLAGVSCHLFMPLVNNVQQEPKNASKINGFDIKKTNL